MLRSSLPIALLISLGLAACGGGGGGGSDESRIADAIRSTAGITDASLCDSLFTDQGVQQTYSEDTPEAGHKDCVDNAKSKPTVKPSDVDVSGVKVTGATATGVGSVKGNKGYFKLRKVGGDWKIDGVSDTPGSSSASTATTETAPAQTTPTATTPSSTDPEVIQVEGSVLAWARAGRGGNKLAFCGLESPSLLKRQTGKGGSAGVVACVKGFHKITSFPKPDSIQFSDASVNGTHAEVSIKAPGKGNTTTLELVKVSGLWKIDNAH